MSQLEKEIESKLVALVKRQGGYCLKWVCPGWSGVPDRIVLLPGARVYFIETKIPKGGRVSALQKWWRETLHKLGFYCELIKNDEELKAFEEIITSAINREARHCL